MRPSFRQFRRFRRFRRFRQLRAIERELCRSEPHLAAMLAIFAALTAGEPIISREQARPAAARMRRVLAALAGAIAGVAVAARWVSGRMMRPCAAAWRWLSRAARIPASTSSATDNPAGPGRSLGL